MKRRRYSRQQWSDWLKEQAGSGATVAAFCRNKSISQKSFYVWRRKLSAELDLKPSEPPPFVPISVVPDSSLQIELPCGAKLSVPAEEAGMRQVLSILLELGERQ